jgi:ornithine cyclodeaminase
MRSITAEQVDRLAVGDLVEALRRAFAGEIAAPERQFVSYEDTAGRRNTLLFMPMSDASSLGVKLLTLTPTNPAVGRPFIRGCYLLFDAADGGPQALIDAPTLTNVRTAATSALASSFLSRQESRTLLVVGTGALAPYMARAHAAGRPIERVWVWGRDAVKATRTAGVLADLGAEAVADLATAAPDADIISCATSAGSPLLDRLHLRPGQHVDLVGSFRPGMQELHEEAVAVTRIYVDTRVGALAEAGDLIVPLLEGRITEDDIVAELADLAAGRHPGRENDEEITLFKSVGHAIEDLVAARLLLQGNDDE